MIASRRKEKCDKLVKDIHAKGYKMDIQTAEVDADDVEQLKALFNSYKPELVINLALPYQDLTIMDACLACGCNYMDTANYEPKDEAHFEYSWQWAYKDKFEQAGLCAILGCGFGQSPISGHNLTNVAITGQGCIDGNGEYWRPLKKQKVTDAQWKQITSRGGAFKRADYWFPSEGSPLL